MSLQERRAELVRAFLDTNTPLEELNGPIIDWFLALKDWERQDTFRKAFKDQRMTARQIDARPDHQTDQDGKISKDYGRGICRTTARSLALPGNSCHSRKEEGAQRDHHRLPAA